MKRASILLPFILFISLSEALSMEIRDTVWTAAKDRLVISYETRRDNGRISLRFLNIQKKLGRENSREYRKLDEISVLFFDRTGNYPDITFSNMVPEAFMVPAVMEYRKSDEGYFFLRDNPELVFTDTDRNDSFVLSIPLYLAHYEGRGRYVLFARADDLKIKIAKESVPHADPGNQYAAANVTQASIVAESGNEATTEALACIQTISMLLEAQQSLPFSDGLQYEIIKLRSMQDRTTNPEVSARIRETLAACEIRKEELRTAQSDAALRAQKEAEAQARIAEEKAREEQEARQAAMKQQAKEEKARNTKLLLGAIGFGILCLVGNQVFQHYRNIRNQKNMMEIQQSLTRQAANEVKRRTNSYARNQTRKVVNMGKDSIREKVGGKKVKKRNISI